MLFLTKIPKPETFRDFGEPRAFNIWMRWALGIAGVVCVGGLVICVSIEGCGKQGTTETVARETGEKPKPAPPPDLHSPVRPAPASFPPDSNLPRGKEIYASGPIELKTFNETNDLARFEDPRVWFESDHDTHGKENDHLIHRAMEVPLKRLVNLLEKKGGKLKVQDAYRHPEINTIHLASSLHCEGRAIDLTCEGPNLSELAKLCWQAGFDFVLYEVPRKAGVHLHCSVKRSPDATLPPRPAK